jgi:hypothetical protein
MNVNHTQHITIIFIEFFVVTIVDPEDCAESLATMLDQCLAIAPAARVTAKALVAYLDEQNLAQPSLSIV